MIKKLSVENFKSIKHLSIDCKRINIFIGEPNTGKSNILESIGIFSFPFSHNIKDLVRFERISNLFYDETLDEPVKIELDKKICQISFKQSMFYCSCYEATEKGGKFPFFEFRYDYGGQGDASISNKLPIKFYRFTLKEKFPRIETDFLLPPSGDNLLSVLMAHKELKSISSQIFQSLGLRLVFKPQEEKIEVLKHLGDIFISYPYSIVSDTLQRIIFYLVAIKSNSNSVLIFEEPEAHAFPYYMKYLAERITLDKNQYFISTHNPYFLLSIAESAPKKDIGVFITYFEDFQTKVKPLTENEVEEVLEKGIDIFFNLDSFIRGEE